MRKLILALLAVAGTAFADPVPPSSCPNCILSTNSAQNAQINIGTATIRGTLTVSTVTVANFHVADLTVTNILGSGSGLTSLNAAQLASGVVPSARVTGAYTGITTLGTITGGTWEGDILVPQYGGTGQNWSNVGQGNLPYFSALGLMTTLSPSTTHMLLQTGGPSGNPSWTGAPTVLGTNVTQIPLANLVTGGTLPSSIGVADASLTAVSGTKITGNINGTAANISGTLAIGQLGAGNLAADIVAQTLNNIGTPVGTFGGPYMFAQVTTNNQGRVTNIVQFPLISTFTARADVDNNWNHAQTSQSSWTINNTIQATTFAGGTFTGDGTTLTGIVKKAGDTMTGALTVAGTSVTANAYYGDGSHLTGLSSAEANTFTSSKTFTAAVLGKSSITANAFFGEGSHLTGVLANVPGVTNTRFLQDVSNINSVGWNLRQSYDSFANLSQDWGVRREYDSSMNVAHDYNLRQLYDTLGFIAVDYDAHVLKTSAGLTPLKWSGPNIVISTNIVSNSSITASAFFGNGAGLTNLSNGVIYPIAISSGGTGTTDSTLRNGGQISIDWGNYLANSPGPVLSINWSARQLYDQSTVLSQDWALRQLYDSGQNIAIDYQARRLKNFQGTTVSDWSGPNIVISTTVVALGFSSNSDRSYNYPYGATSTGTAVVANSDGRVIIGSTTPYNGSNSGIQYNTDVANRAQIRVNAYGNHNGVSGMTCTKSRGALGVDSSVTTGDVLCRTTVSAAAGTPGSKPNVADASFEAATVNATTMGVNYNLRLMNNAGTLATKLFVTSEGQMTVTQGVQAASATINGVLTSISSVNASGFFGDGSHLTGIASAGETNTFVSSKTFTNNVLIDGTLKVLTAIQTPSLSALPAEGSNLTVAATDGVTVAGGNLTLAAGNETVGGNGGNTTITAGNGTNIGDGGAINITAGSNFAPHIVANGGPVNITAGTGGATGTGGTMTLTAGAQSNNGAAGNMNIAAGASTGGNGGNTNISGGDGDSKGGNITITPGNSGSGPGGNLILNGGTGVTQGSVTVNALMIGSSVTLSGLLKGTSAQFTGEVTASTVNLVGSALKVNGSVVIDHATNIVSQGSVTASAFFGDGSGLTGVGGGGSNVFPLGVITPIVTPSSTSIDLNIYTPESDFFGTGNAGNVNITAGNTDNGQGNQAGINLTAGSTPAGQGTGSGSTGGFVTIIAGGGAHHRGDPGIGGNVVITAGTPSDFGNGGNVVISGGVGNDGGVTTGNGGNVSVTAGSGTTGNGTATLSNPSGSVVIDASGNTSINSGTNIVYRCVGGADDGVLFWNNTNAGHCVGGTYTATSFNLN